MSKRRREHWAPPACKSGKASFRSQGRALRALSRHHGEAAQSIVPVALPVGVYHCGCGAWHWTSKAYGSTVLLPGLVLDAAGGYDGAHTTTRPEEGTMDGETEQGSTGAEDGGELREEDVTAADGLNDDVREGDEGSLPGDDAA